MAQRVDKDLEEKWEQGFGGLGGGGFSPIRRGKKKTKDSTGFKAPEVKSFGDLSGDAVDPFRADALRGRGFGDGTFLGGSSMPISNPSLDSMTGEATGPEAAPEGALTDTQEGLATATAINQVAQHPFVDLVLQALPPVVSVPLSLGRLGLNTEVGKQNTLAGQRAKNAFIHQEKDTSPAPTPSPTPFNEELANPFDNPTQAPPAPPTVSPFNDLVNPIDVPTPPAQPNYFEDLTAPFDDLDSAPTPGPTSAPADVGIDNSMGGGEDGGGGGGGGVGDPGDSGGPGAFHTGGYVAEDGRPGREQNARLLEGEYVMNPQATQQNRAQLEAMNQGQGFGGLKSESAPMQGMGRIRKLVIEFAN